MLSTPPSCSVLPTLSCHSSPHTSLIFSLFCAVGLLHYSVHSCDVLDPAVTIRGYPSASTLDAVANQRLHALHMLTHLSLVFGNWSEMEKYNAASVATSDAYCALSDVDGSRTICDAGNRYHSLEWQHYGIMQQCKFRAALPLLYLAQEVSVQFTCWLHCLQFSMQFAWFTARRNLVPLCQMLPPDDISGCAYRSLSLSAVWGITKCTSTAASSPLYRYCAAAALLYRWPPT